MSSTLTVYDETLSGDRTPACTLDFLSERVTVRELVRARVWQEVQDYNLRLPELFQGLVQPTDTERTLNGFRLRTRRRIDWEAQAARALEAFERNGFMVLVDDRQAESLDEEIVIRLDTTVSFLKLVPLVGG
ncbi:MAG TPA: hypothetical protein VF615_13310 [Longimicrobiaceae bacterium]|jgi:hypothetical protein